MSEWLGQSSNVPRPKVWEQPSRLVRARWREHGQTFVELDECGHIEPATGKDLWHHIRCQQCNPVRRSTAPPVPIPNPDDLLEPTA